MCLTLGVSSSTAMYCSRHFLHVCDSRLRIYVCDFNSKFKLAIRACDLCNSCASLLSMLGKNFSRFHFEIFFSYFHRK